MTSPEDGSAGASTPNDGQVSPPPKKSAAKPGGKGKAKPAGTVGERVPSNQAHPVARPARMKRRHWGLMVSFAAVVLVPLAAIVVYLWIFAVDQYGSVTGFTVRQEEQGAASELLGGLSALTGTGGSSDADILYEFIQSQEMVRGVDAALDLRGHFTAPFPVDPVFALWPGASIEDLQEHWQRKVRITFDQSSGLIEVRALAFGPDMAYRINEEIVARSQAMINDLNLQSREDAMRYARADLDEALARLKVAREAMTTFRTQTQIVDPQADIQGRMGVMNNLQQQLAQALIDYDLLLETTNDGDPRLRQAQQRIEVIRGRIASERKSFATDDTAAGPTGEDYPTLIAEYEGLVVDREFAEETYRASLAALDLARAKASRQSRYLATYIPPTLPERAEYPQRLILTGIAAAFLMLLWSVMALIYYSIRDRG